MVRSFVRLGCLLLAMSLLAGCIVEPPGYWHDDWGRHHGWHHDRD